MGDAVTRLGDPHPFSIFNPDNQARIFLRAATLLRLLAKESAPSSPCDMPDTCGGCGNVVVRVVTHLNADGAHHVCPKDSTDPVCEHGTALDVHCCDCHSGFIFDKDHECPAQNEDQEALCPLCARAGGESSLTPVPNRSPRRAPHRSKTPEAQPLPEGTETPAAVGDLTKDERDAIETLEDAVRGETPGFGIYWDKQIEKVLAVIWRLAAGGALPSRASKVKLVRDCSEAELDAIETEAARNALDEFSAKSRDAVRTPALLRSRAAWYREGCPHLEDRDGYWASGDLLRDVADDLEAALAHAKR